MVFNGSIKHIKMEKKLWVKELMHAY